MGQNLGSMPVKDRNRPDLRVNSTLSLWELEMT